MTAADCWQCIGETCKSVNPPVSSVLKNNEGTQNIFKKNGKQLISD